MQMQLSQQAGAAKPVRAGRAPRKFLRVRATATAEPAVSSAAALKKQVVEDEAKYVLQTYGRPSDVVFVKGHGCTLVDAEGKEYLDMAAGGPLPGAALPHRTAAAHAATGTL